MITYRLPIKGIVDLSKLMLLKTQRFTIFYIDISYDDKDFNHRIFNELQYYPIVHIGKDYIAFDFYRMHSNYDVISISNSVKLILKS